MGASGAICFTLPGRAVAGVTGISCKRSPRRQVEGAQLHKHKRPEVAAALAHVLIEKGVLPAHAAGPTMHLAWLKTPGGSDCQSCGSACSQSEWSCRMRKVQFETRCSRTVGSRTVGRHAFQELASPAPGDQMAEV